MRKIKNNYLWKTNWKKLLIILITTSLVMPIMFIPLRGSFALRKNPQPQGILVLSGNQQRIEQAARFSESYPHLDFWVSCSRREFNFISGILAKESISPSRLHYDLCATDTVTNFTCMVSRLKENKINHVYLITSDYHMRRARTIAFLVFGSQGIVITPVSIPSDKQQQESWWKLGRDLLRSWLWILSGIDRITIDSLPFPFPLSPFPFLFMLIQPIN